MTSNRNFDVLLIGSGFGGSLLATILSRQGMSVAVVDRARHPRFAIGESSTPAADLLLRVLTKQYDLPELRPLCRFGSWRETYPDVLCGCKRGFSYFWHAGPHGFQPDDHRHELLVAANASRDVADTQWYRPDVDQLLASVAQRWGVTLFEAAEIRQIEHLREHNWTVTIEQADRPCRLSAAFVIDASGSAGLLLNHLQVADITGQLRTRSSAVYSHFWDTQPIGDWLSLHNVPTADHPYPCRDSFIHHLFDHGWLWQIRFENDLTSLGYVSPDVAAHQSADARWANVVKQHPELHDILGTPRLADVPGQILASGRLQRLRASAAGLAWAALPNSAGFIDPLHSTGNAHTLAGIERLAGLLLTSTGKTRADRLARYSNELLDQLFLIDRLVAGCYRSLGDFRLFAAWSMLYFAAATTFEKRLLAAADTVSENLPGYLCADDERLTEMVSEQYDALEHVTHADNSASENGVIEFCQQLRKAVEPFNHVGLFAPALPNMYRYTAAAK